MAACHPFPSPTHPPAGKLLPPFLFLVTPTTSSATNSTAQGQRAPVPGTSRSPAPSALLPSAPLLLPLAGTPLSSLLRGALALLLRTCSAADPRDNWLHLALGQQVRWECVLLVFDACTCGHECKRGLWGRRYHGTTGCTWRVGCQWE